MNNLTEKETNDDINQIDDELNRNFTLEEIVKIQIQTTLEPHPNIHSSTLKAVHISKQPKPKSLTDKTLVRTLAKSVNKKGTT